MTSVDRYRAAVLARALGLPTVGARVTHLFVCRRVPSMARVHRGDKKNRPSDLMTGFGIDSLSVQAINIPDPAKSLNCPGS